MVTNKKSRSRGRKRKTKRRKKHAGAMRDDPKEYVLLSNDYKSAKGSFISLRPSQAVLKAAKYIFPDKKEHAGAKKISIMQVTKGKGFGDIYIYDVTQKLVKPSKWRVKTLGHSPGKKYIERFATRKKKIPARSATVSPKDLGIRKRSSPKGSDLDRDDVKAKKSEPTILTDDKTNSTATEDSEPTASESNNVKRELAMAGKRGGRAY